MSTYENTIAPTETAESLQLASKHDAIHLAAERGHAATDRYGNPLIEIDRKAEARLRLKIDLCIVPTVALLYLFCFIDRANIGNARLAGLEKDLGMAGLDYNIVLSVFYVGYIFFELPSTVACKWIGPGRFLPAISLGFGLASVCAAFANTKAQICGVRFVLGIFEAGVLPGFAYYLSRWYRRSELAFRLSLYIAMAPLAGAVSGLLASGILKLDHFGSLTSWRMIFAIEGTITIGLALISFFTLTDRPEVAWWLTQNEKDLAISRVKSERIGATRVLDSIDLRKITLGISSPVTLGTSFVFLLGNITAQGLAFFLPTIIRTIYPSYSTIQQQLYSVPPYIVGVFFTILLPLLSWRTDNRQIFLILSGILPIIGYALFLATTDSRTRYGATFLLASSIFVSGALGNAQISANVITDTARSSGIGINVLFGNIGGLIATWSFLPWDGPRYPIGNGLNLATSSLIVITSTLVLLWMKYDNKKREARDVDTELDGLSSEEIANLDWKHPGFRWKP